MTCVVGIAQMGGRVWIGADSLSGYPDTGRVQIVRDPKVFRLGEVLIGFTTSWRMGQLLRYRLKVPIEADSVSNHEWLATAFIDAVRRTLADGGWAKKEHNVEEGGTFLVGYRGRLYRVESDFHVSELAEGVGAVGCGETYALGVLHATRDLRWSPPNRIRRALAAAAHYNAFVRPPWRIRWVKTR